MGNKTRDFFPLASSMISRLNPAGQWPVAGGGGVSEQAGSKGIRLGMVGRRGAHRGGQAMVRGSAVKCMMMVERIAGHQGKTSGRRGTSGVGEP
jgi:hypothetical protein